MKNLWCHLERSIIVAKSKDLVQLFLSLFLCAAMLVACSDDDSNFATRPSDGSSSSVCEDCDDGFSSGVTPKSNDSETSVSSSSTKSSSSSAKSSSSVTLATPCKTETEDNCEYGELTDDRDGKKYKTVKIGDQWWMAENLNYETGSNFCFSYGDTNCVKYGRLYAWGDAMDSAGTWSTNGKGCGRFGKDCAPLMARCIELGRSFIVSDYQRDVLALKSLFTGLALTVTAHPECDYFLGPVSISNAYPTFYKSLMVYFLQNHYPFTEEAGVAVPTHPFQPDWLKVNPADLLAGCRDVEDLDRLMARLSDGRYRIPVLVRQYFKMGARLVCFNIDKLFNDSLDGLILLKFADYPENTLRSVARCLPAGDYERVMKRFGYGC